MESEASYLGFIKKITETFFSKKKKAKIVAEPTWTTKDGRTLKISEMEISHCKSVVAWMERQCYGTNIKNLWMYEALQKDVRYLALKERIKNHKVGTKWKYRQT